MIAYDGSAYADAALGELASTDAEKGLNSLDRRLLFHARVQWRLETLRIPCRFLFNS